MQVLCQRRTLGLFFPLCLTCNPPCANELQCYKILHRCTNAIETPTSRACGACPGSLPRRRRRAHLLAWAAQDRSRMSSADGSCEQRPSATRLPPSLRAPTPARRRSGSSRRLTATGISFAHLIAPGGSLESTSRLQKPADPPPHWLYGLLAGAPRSRLSHFQQTQRASERSKFTPIPTTR